MSVQKVGLRPRLPLGVLNHSRPRGQPHRQQTSRLPAMYAFHFVVLYWVRNFFFCEAINLRAQARRLVQQNFYTHHS